jgi:phosphohistidine swiveling domain-containing protein
VKAALITVAAGLTTSWVAHGLEVPAPVVVGVFVGFVLLFAGAVDFVQNEVSK